MRATLTLLLLFVLSSSPLLSQEEGFEFVNPPITLVVLGSSTAEGIGTWPRDNAWVNRYRGYVQMFNPSNQVINLGKGGFDTYSILPTDSVYTKNRRVPDTTRNFTKALQYKPDGIIINLPSNDVANGYSVEEQLSNFNYLSELAASNNIPLWVTTTQARNFPEKQDRQIQHDLKDSLLALFPNTYIDFWTGFCDEDFIILKQHDSGDGCHLNNDAHKILLDRVIESKAFIGKLEATGFQRSTEDQEEMPPYMLSVGFDGTIDKNSSFQSRPATVKIKQGDRVLAVYSANNTFFQIEAIVDMRTPFEVIFESDYCLSKVIECDFINAIDYDDSGSFEVFYPLETLDFEEVTLEMFNYRFVHDELVVARFYFDTITSALELDWDFTLTQSQRILDAFLEPPLKGNKLITRWGNGKKKSILKFKNGQLTRKSKWYGENGKKERFVNFRNGQYHGKYIKFNTEGKKKSLRIFENDEQVGETKTFD
ncbi:MAG: hypothetical protein COA38_12860 [Fluviicola sp.]|nr:MAG: hypothetical protein COA38_12860 [Fluviicola sp.]